jgi:putative spermidine/putrescine transport system substrate-binding protein
MSNKLTASLLTAALSAGLMISLNSSAALAQQATLVVSNFAIAQDLMRKDLYAPFEAKCNCKIVVDAGNAADRLAKLEARKGNPEADIAVLADFTALEAARKDLIEPIDTSKLSNFNKLYDFAKDPIGKNYGVGYTFYATSIIYRKDKIDVTSWADLWSPKLKNRLALPNITTTQAPLLLFMVEQALNGKTPDFAASIDKIGSIKGDVVTFYERAAQLTQLFQQDEIYATVTGRYNWPLITKLNMPIAWATPKEGLTGGLNVLTVVKGSKNKELAYALINEWLSTDAQTRIANDLVDSPANREVKLAPEIADQLSYGEDVAKSLKVIPPEQVLANRDAWIAGWNAKIAR